MIGLARAPTWCAGSCAGATTVVYDVTPDAAGSRGGRTGGSLEEFVGAGAAPLHLHHGPAAFVDDTVAKLVPLLQADDTIIDGGNSWYRYDLRRAAALGEQGLHHVDMGTSGVFGPSAASAS
jgi:6-phosphogluconate dehydrogenase